MTPSNQKEDLYTYLLDKPLSLRVAHEHESRVKHFKAFCREKDLPPEQLRYADLLPYVERLKEKGLSLHTVNIHLVSLKHYYAYLVEEGERIDNPAGNLKVKAPRQTLRKDLLKREELEAVYHIFRERTTFYHPLDKISHDRNTIILGLILYQALHSGSIALLEVQHLNLKKGTIYIPGTSTTNSRTLPLDARQIMPIQEYLTTIRPLLQPKGEELIPGRVHRLIAHMFSALRKRCPHINNALQVRASVITEWLKHRHIRKVQYQCGHKKIGSTERYKTGDLDALKSAIERHHPLR